MRRHIVSLAGSFATVLTLAVSGTASAQDVAPPPPMAPPPIDPNSPGAPNGDPNAGPAGEAATAQRLDTAEREDSGRQFEIFWMDAQLGGSYINMKQFSEETLGIVNADSGGPMFSLGAGLRFVVLVLGVRAKYNALSAFNMWQLNLEAGVKLPIDKFDIMFGAHGGYSFVGSLGDSALATSSAVPTSTDAVSVRGFNAGLDFAVDYYVTPVFSVGGGLFGDFLYLNRPAVAIPDGITDEARAAIANDSLYQKSGTSAGMQIGGGLRLGVHFGL